MEQVPDHRDEPEVRPILQRARRVTGHEARFERGNDSITSRVDLFRSSGGPPLVLDYPDRELRKSGIRGLRRSPLGIGDGAKADFQLAKTYGDAGGSSTRVIAKPVAGTVVVAVDGVAKPAAAFFCDTATGVVSFASGHVPPAGASVTAGFEFDVPVRFATGRIDVNLTAFNAGRIPAIPLMEILP